jgi:hypothetical protein
MGAMSHFARIDVCAVAVDIRVVRHERRRRDIGVIGDRSTCIAWIYHSDGATILVRNTQAEYLHVERSEVAKTHAM